MLGHRLEEWFGRTKSARASKQVDFLSIALASDVGLVREQNQDRVGALIYPCSQPDRCSFAAIALSDGMGGMREGERCAAMAISTFMNFLINYRGCDLRDALRGAVLGANQRVFEAFNGNGGATLSAIVVSKNEVLLANVGDSRIYAASGGQNIEVLRLTTDDSIEDALGGHNRDLLQFVGVGPGLSPHIDEIDREIVRAFISSDGIHFINGEFLSDLFRKTPQPKQLVDRLSAVARWLGGHDNSSIACVNIQDLRAELLKFSSDDIVRLWDPWDTLEIMIIEKASESVNPKIAPTTQAMPVPASKREPAITPDKEKGKPKKPKRKRKKPLPPTDNEKEEQPKFQLIEENIDDDHGEKEEGKNE